MANINDELDSLSFQQEGDNNQLVDSQSESHSLLAPENTHPAPPRTDFPSPTSSSSRSQDFFVLDGSSDIDPAFLLNANNTPMGGRVRDWDKTSPVPNFYRSSRSNLGEDEHENRQKGDNFHSSQVTIKEDYGNDGFQNSNTVYPDTNENEETVNIPRPHPQTFSNQRSSNVANDRFTLNNVNHARKSNLRTTLPQIIFRLRLVNLVTTSLTILCMGLTLWTKFLNVPQLILSVYAICFCALLLLYELHIRWYIADLIHDNFGFIYSSYGRAFYIIFCGSMCLTQGLLPFIFGCILILNGLFNTYAICKYSDYRHYEETMGRQDVRTFATTSTAEAAGWNVPSWATTSEEPHFVSPTSSGSTGNQVGGTYGSVA